MKGIYFFAVLLCMNWSVMANDKSRANEIITNDGNEYVKSYDYNNFSKSFSMSIYRKSHASRMEEIKNTIHKQEQELNSRGYRHPAILLPSNNHEIINLTKKILTKNDILKLSECGKAFAVILYVNSQKRVLYSKISYNNCENDNQIDEKIIKLQEKLSEIVVFEYPSNAKYDMYKYYRSHFPIKFSDLK